MVLQQTHAVLAVAFSSGKQARLTFKRPGASYLPSLFAFRGARFAGRCLLPRWWQSYLLLMCGMLIDVDHLLADPVYDPLRCSMGFHPLHTWPFVLAYVAMAFVPRTRILGIGLVIHMLLDTGDCLLMPQRFGVLNGFFELPFIW
jgi:hypothetical protein